MSDSIKENISDLLFQNVDSIVIVDAQNGTYQSVKRTGLFENIIKENGNYNDLLEKLWF
ncbi:MAG: GGDEF domain-containing protein, partial [Treponema bryantii]|nr:GGDEF domain-containing protein [Treponema bryantii]